MDKSTLPLSTAMEHYLLACQTEGKSPATLGGYREKLGRYVRREGGTVGQFTIDAVRGYVAALQKTPRWDGEPRGNAQPGRLLSPETILDHVRILRGFATWLYEEGYTAENVLKRLKPPKVPATIIDILNDDEIRRVLAAVDQNVSQGSRDLAILTLFLDTGIRLSELVGLALGDLHLEEQWLKVMGKGSRERFVPFGSRAAKVLARYVTFFRDGDDEPEVPLFLASEGRPLTGNAVQLLFGRLRERTGIRRLHPHLLRHTFATNYLVAGGDVFTLQTILGHTTLEMTRRYVSLASSHVAVQHKRFSPMDRLEGLLLSSRVPAARPAGVRPRLEWSLYPRHAV